MAISWAEAGKRGHAIARDYLAGMTQEQVAAKHGITGAAVCQRLKVLGIKARRPGQKRTFPAVDILLRILRGEAVREIAAERGCCIENVWLCLYRRGIRGAYLSRWLPILDWDTASLEVLRSAIEDSGMSMEDAFELVTKSQPHRRAA